MIAERLDLVWARWALPIAVMGPGRDRRVPGSAEQQLASTLAAVARRGREVVVSRPDRQSTPRPLADPVGTVSAGDGQTRVLLRLPSWEDYVNVALDEAIAMSAASLQVRRRVDRLLTELVAIAPPGRRQCFQARIERA